MDVAERASEHRTRTLLPLKHVTFRPGQTGDDLIARHGNAGTAAKTMVQRYLWLMRRYKPTLRLTAAEARTCAVALRGYDLNDTTLDLIWAKLEAEVRDQNMAEIYVGLEPAALVAKVRNYTPVQAIALIDAVEVFWRSGADDDDALEASGLLA